MLSLIAKIFNSIPIWLWIVLVTSLVALFTLLIQKNSRLAARYGICTFMITSLFSLFFSWLNYLDNHFVGSYSEHGLPENFSASGWRLIFDAWPLWLGPVVLVCGLVLFMYWVYTESQLMDFIDDTHTGSREVPSKPGGPASKSVIMHSLESAKLKRKLAVAEEKYKMALDKKSKPSVKDTRTTMSIKQLREQLVETKRINSALKSEIEALKSDLERTNNLVDQLLEEKYGKNS